MNLICCIFNEASRFTSNLLNNKTMKLLRNTSKCVFITLCLFSSCTKSDFTKSESISQSSSDEAVAAAPFPDCKLRRIIHENAVSDQLVNGLFSYNAAGNPVSLTYGSAASLGNPNHYFFYDNQNRLREWREAYSLTVPDLQTRHKYGYNSNNIIVVDSLLQFALVSDEGEVYFGDTTIIDLTYDSEGRVVKEALRNIKGGATRYRTYTYDNRGNLGVLGWKSSSYDYKVSIFRSHPVFQFIFRNYSKNNAAAQPKYNSKGLPLSLRPSNDVFFNALQSNPGGGLIGGIYKAIYDCQ